MNDYDNIPHEMRGLKAWLVWRYETKERDGGRKAPKALKVPFYAGGGRRMYEQGSPEDRSRLVTFDEAVKAAADMDMSGIGFAFFKDWGLVGIDFDKCVHPLAGTVRNDVKQLVNGHYCEVSPSGTGLRVIARGDLIGGKSLKPGGMDENSEFSVEFFGHSGFVTMTGDLLEPRGKGDLEALGDRLSALYKERIGDRSGAIVDVMERDLSASPVTASELSTWRAMLFAIPLEKTAEGDNDMPYQPWLEVGMALHDLSGGDTQAMALWDEWSQGLASYDRKELEAKWRSFGRNSGNRGRITGRTLEYMARQGGWEEDVTALFTEIESEGVARKSRATEERGNDNGKDRPVIKNERDHLAIAKLIIRTDFQQDGHPCLWRDTMSGDWFRWNGRCYERTIDEAIINDVRRFLSRAMKTIEIKQKGSKKKHGGTDGGSEPGLNGTDGAPSPDNGGGKILMTVPFDPTPAQISGIFNALKTAAEPQHALTSGSRLPGFQGDSGQDCDFITLQDGLFNVRTRELIPHTPLFFSTNALPYTWGNADEPNGCSKWLRFLSDVFPDQDSVDTLQEIAGYLVTPETRYQKMFLIKGLPRSGKGTIERVLRAMLGPHNVAGTTFNQLGGDFGLWPMIDKTAVFISEARNGRGGHFGENRSAYAVERLLSISGEDSVLVETKGGRYYEHHLKCRIVMTANDVPALGDSSGAFASRFITLTTQGTWLGRENENLTDELCAELPGILRWALDGLDRLRARGRFVQPAAGKAVMEDLADMQNPVRRFLKECCEPDIRSSERKQDVYHMYKIWFHENIGNRPTSAQWFAKSLATAYRELYGRELFGKRDTPDSPWMWEALKMIKNVI